MPKVSAERREQVRQHLLDAARTVILRDGADQATTRAILAEAGMATGSLYTYFATKEDLFAELAEQLIGESVALFSAAGRAGENATGLTLRFVGDLLTHADSSPALVYFRGRLSADPEVRAAIARFNRYVVRTFAPMTEAAQKEGELRADLDAEALIELVDILVDGLNRRHVAGSFVTSFDRVGRTAFVVLLAGALAQEAIPLP